MMRSLSRCLFAGVLLVGTANVHAGDPDGWLLDATFAGLPLNQPIGTGGAAAGQPDAVSTLVDAIVRHAPMATRHLEITWDGAPSTASGVRFSLAGGVEVERNLLSITLDFHAHVASRYYVQIRESTSAARSFGGIYLMEEGILSLFDAAGSPIVTFDFPFGQSRTLRWDYDLDARTYDFSIDGARLVQGRAHGVPDDGRGIGSILVGLDWNTPANTALSVDNVRVFAGTDALFAHGFDPP